MKRSWATPRRRRKKAAAAKLAERRVRMGRVHGRPQTEPEPRDQLCASEIARAAARLRAVNERQVRDGVERLRADLKAFRDLGIVDEHNKRIRRKLPAEMAEDVGDVV